MSTQTAPVRPRHGALRFVRDIVIILACALLISFVVKTFVVRSFYIPSGSMESTLQIGDRILVNEFVPKVAALNRGDVVVFTDPGGWLDSDAIPATAPQPAAVEAIQSALTAVGLGTHDSDDHLIKRVIGLPGDTVSCCNASGELQVNGVPIKEPYITIAANQTKASPNDFSVTVPPGMLWVMGDNRYDSADSEYHNARKDVSPYVPISDVVGRAFVITWPQKHWSALSDYPDVFDRVRDAKLH
ncbi:signal peptidase I [Frondihabitans sp. PhB188]|uniref:signal peptidase I n=1 Tax=Frondihabitans sp. PhB188 TaxID=2485200 RepID=UPI000F487122|nr:signal peptidase I [Frondihabitans sp. PhB188]ROQ36994.1 signal peptidase I [Frondihabitans sp. PhB188]